MRAHMDRMKPLTTLGLCEYTTTRRSSVINFISTITFSFMKVISWRRGNPVKSAAYSIFALLTAAMFTYRSCSIYSRLL